MAIQAAPKPKTEVRVLQFPGEPARAYTNFQLWDRRDHDVVSLCKLSATDAWKGTDEENERHRIFAHLLMAIVLEYWNGNKNGRRGRYPMNVVQDPIHYEPSSGDPDHLNDDYYGHNIAALAVDAKGKILDFDFNHNDLFNSSAEHAEARLVRRLFSLAQIGEAWPDPLASSNGKSAEEARAQVARALGNESTPQNTHPAKKSYPTLKEVTVYTSLESCAQCSGVMALAGVKRVVYLQTDPGTYWIGRILRNLTSEPMLAPLPISGQEIGFSLFSRLDEAYMTFATRSDQPFWEPDGDDADPSVAITSFLCTRAARDLFVEGATLPDSLVSHPEFRHVVPPSPAGKHECKPQCGLSNDEVLKYARDFLKYATKKGRRGTPHNL